VTLLGSVATRLSVGLLAVVVGVLAIVYLIVVPSYRNSLENAELRTLATAVRAGSSRYATDPQWPTSMAEQYAVRAVVFTVAPVPLTVTPFADSNQTTNDSSLVDDPVALKAARTLKPAHGLVHREGHTAAEAAIPAPPAGPGSPVLLVARSFDEQIESVAVVRRRVFFAGALAVGFTLLLGYLGASLFTARIRRLEHAAERIAAGDFDQAVVDPGADELAQLARAFERMRLRLARLDRARGAFIANASHELRTPLFSLGGFLELLDDPELDEATREEFLGRMREQVERLTKLATDLLDLSRLDAGRIAVATEPIDLSGLADELAAEFGPRARSGGHALSIDAPRPVEARGDAARVLQIGRILIENALVHTPAGTPIRLATGREGGRATLSVRDEGPGIPPEAQTNVFERFFRVDGNRASGSGLGLAIARELAEVMDGRIELASDDDATSFTLVLAAVSRENAAALSRENAR
jgi:signal transduction histidine kinase